jgi:hypothetical protein
MPDPDTTTPGTPEWTVAYRNELLHRAAQEIAELYVQCEIQASRAAARRNLLWPGTTEYNGCEEEAHAAALESREDSHREIAARLAEILDGLRDYYHPETILAEVHH